MRDWLRRVIEENLSYALKWQVRAYPSIQLAPETQVASSQYGSPSKYHTKSYQGIWKWDGSNLRTSLAHSTKEAKFVQLLEVCTHGILTRIALLTLPLLSSIQKANTGYRSQQP